MPTVKSYLKRYEALKKEFTTFRSLYGELSDYHLANRGRFLVSDRNKGHKRNTKQINNTSRMALRTLASGMSAGITSPARPWFRLSSGDATLDDYSSVKSWLFDVQTIMYNVFAASNFYNCMSAVYQELGCFGTTAIGAFENFDTVVWFKQYTIGSFVIAANDQGIVDTFYREYDMTVANCVKMFGYDNCSNSVKKQWDDGNTEDWVTVIHVIEPNDDRDQNSPLAKDKKYRSVYFELASGSNRTQTDKFLRQSGFDEFPTMCPRWDVTGEDVYATDCPGITALGDTKALQLGERRKYQALDKIVDPPLQAPSTMRTQLANGQAPNGSITFYEGAVPGIKSIYDMRPDINAMDQSNDRTEYRIKRAFYEDLFLMLANTDRREITAREVAEKHEEKLLMLGPMLERLHSELLDPIIDRVFNILQRNGVLPPPPEELREKELTIQYVSVLAQAQRMVATGSVERLAQFAGVLVGVWPEAKHKINATQMVDDYADALGVNPAVIRSDDEVAQMVEADNQMQRAQMMAMAGQQVADIAKTASEAKTTDDNVLGNMARNMGAM